LNRKAKNESFLYSGKEKQNRFFRFMLLHKGYRKHEKYILRASLQAVYEHLNFVSVIKSNKLWIN